jgi:hypothetical protein
MICEICGDEKQVYEFHRVKYFTFLMPNVTAWCRDCQKLYIGMLKEKKRISDLAAKKGSLVVGFE